MSAVCQPNHANIRDKPESDVVKIMMGSIALTLGMILLLCALYLVVGLSNLNALAIGIGIVALFLLQCGAKMILNGSKASGRAPCCAPLQLHQPLHPRKGCQIVRSRAYTPNSTV